MEKEVDGSMRISLIDDSVLRCFPEARVGITHIPYTEILFLLCYENQTSFEVMGKGLAGARLKLASAKMAKVPTVVKTTKIQRNMRSTTMAT